MSKIKKMILSAMLLAVLILFSRFISIKTQVLIISFSFVPIMMAGIWLGPKYSLAIAALGDLIGAILFPFGPYFPGFTVSAAISGWIYGVFLHHKGQAMENKQLLFRLIVSSVIELIFVQILLTSFWIHMLYGKAYLAIIASRVITQILMIPIHVITIYGLEKFSRPLLQKYLCEETEL